MTSGLAAGHADSRTCSVSAAHIAGSGQREKNSPAARQDEALLALLRCSTVPGYGAAYLYLTALEVPAVAARVYEALADVLDTPSGRYAQLVAAALIIRNLTRLPDSGGLAARLHDHTDTLLA
ncbi:MAG TPA: hypothetical protein VGG75_34590 [Trebonia sp.]